MKKLLKIAALAGAAFLVLLIVAAVIFTLTFDPNAYKKEITAEVKKATGRTLQINGKIKLSYFPWLGVSLNKLTLSNARGFGSQPMAKIDNAAVAVKVLPLITGDIVVKRLTLNGLVLDARVNKAGRNNWDDLAGKESKPEKKSDSGVPAFTIGGVQIRNANISYVDEQAGERYAMKKLNLQTGEVSFGRPIDLNLDFILEDKKNKLPVSLATLLSLDMKKQTAKLQKMSLAINDFRVEGDIKATQIFDRPAVKGSIQTNTFDLGALLKTLGSPQVTADKNALTKVSLKADMAFANNIVRLDKMAMKLDDSNIDGNATVNLDTSAIGFNLNIDNIDADRYLAPDDGKSTGNETVLTVQDIRGLNGMNGRLSIGKLKAFGINSQKMSTTIAVNNNKAVIGPSKASLYGGSYQGRIVVDASGTTPKVTLNEKVSSIRLDQFLRDAAGTTQISGIGSVTLSGTTQGKSSNALTRNLNGKLNMFAKDGKVKGLDLKKITTTALNWSDKLKKRKPRVKVAKGDETAFKTLTMSAAIKQGVAHTNDLSAKGPNLEVKGKGTVDALTLAQNLDVDVYIIESATGKKKSISLKIGGTVDNPKVFPSFARAIEKEKAKLKTKTQKSIEKKKQSWRDKLKKKLGK